MNKQAGSAHLVIIIMLATVLIGSLGFLFWRNFIQAEPSTDKAEIVLGDNKTDTQPKLFVGRIGETFGLNMEYQYPETWKLEKTINGPNPASDDISTSEKITLSSVGTYSVNLNLASGGLGGTCSESDTGVIKSFEYQSLDGLKDAVFVKSVATNGDGKFLASARLYKITDYFRPAEIKAGDSACKLYLGFLNFETAQVSTISFVETDIVNSEQSEGGYSTLEDAKQALSGKLFEEAQATLMSLSSK